MQADTVKNGVCLRDFLERYREWLAAIDAAFDRVRRAYPEAVPCHGGCSQCCYALFAVPAIDGYLIREGLRRMPGPASEPMMTRCGLLFDDFRSQICPEAVIPFRIETVGWKDFERMAERFQRCCPFLTETGWCGIYDWRPKICRLAGTVFRDPVTGLELPDFCPTAQAARERAGFRSAPMDLAALDAGMLDFIEEFQMLLGTNFIRGHTFPAAGVLEGRDCTAPNPKS